MAVQPIPNFMNLTPLVSGTGTPAVRATALVTPPSEGSPATQASSTEPAPTQPSPLKQPSREQLDQAMKEVKQALPLQARDLQFSIDDETGQTVIKVMDPATKEVIRQIPSEELLAITKALDKFTGLLTKQKV